MKNLMCLLLLTATISGLAQSLKDDQQAIREQIDRLTEIIKTEPTAEHYYMRGYGYYNQGDLNRALADYNKAIALNPDDFDAYYSRGMLYDKASDYVSAVADYTVCINLDGSRAKAFFNRGHSRSKSQDLDGAIADYTQCIALDPKHFAAYLNRGIVRKERNEQELAIADFDQALAINPALTDARQNRAICKAMAGRDDALEDFNKVVQEDPENPETYYNRALYFINYGIKGDYCTDLRKAEQRGFGAARKLRLEKCR